MPIWAGADTAQAGGVSEYYTDLSNRDGGGKWIGVHLGLEIYLARDPLQLKRWRPVLCLLQHTVRDLRCIWSESFKLRFGCGSGEAISA